MLSRPLIVLAVLALVALLAVAWISNHATRVMAHSVAALDQTRDVLLTMDQLRAALAEAEASARGYVITGLASLDSDYHRAARAVRGHLAHLTRLMAGDPRHGTSLADLNALVENRIALFSELVSLKSGNATAPEIHKRVVQGTIARREVAGALDEIRSTELRHFRQEVSNAEGARRYALYGPWVMALIAVVLFASLAVQVVATLRRGNEMRESLRKVALQEQAARERAQKADELKNQFLAAVSHELRTPLTSILGWCGLLGDRLSNRDLVVEGLSNIAQSARIQSRLVEDLLDVSRIVAGRLKLCLADVNAAEAIERAIASVTPSAQAKRIVLSSHLEEPAPMLLADPVRLEQIVWNLLSNAIKFTPPNGTIEVRLRRVDSNVELTVEDDGQGIAPDLLPHIFDRFWQGQTAVTPQGGLGLGLSIVRNLIELHGGTVRAESAGPGAGATFTVELPLDGAARSANAETAPAAAVEVFSS